MHVENLTRLPPSRATRGTPRAEVAGLHRLVARLRWRLGLERAALAAVRGALATSLTVGVVAVALWLTGAETIWMWLAAAPFLAAVIFAVARWPSPLDTAVAADHRFGLEERLSTAFELSQSERGGRYDLAQIRDAVAFTSVAPGGWLALDRRARNEAFLAIAAVVLAATAAVIIPQVPRPVSPLVDLPGEPDEAGAPPAADEGFSPLAASAANQAPSPAQPTQVTSPPADLAARVQQEQAERSALDQLAQGLGNVSAGQNAADAIQQGDFGAAHDQIQSLGQQADQLSQAAKQQLARGLQQAAAASGQSDPALANREQQAAQALSRSTYTDQQQALNALADQVQRSGARSVSADQLQRDQAQLQQQQQQQQQQSAAGQPAPSATSDAGSSQDNPAPSDSASTPASASTSGMPSDQSSGGPSPASAGDAQQAGAGVGTGTSSDPFSDQPSRLDTAGQQVQVPTRLGSGSGVRPADGSEDQTSQDPNLGGKTVSEQAQPQQTGQVTPEQNLVPGEQRPVVRGYFR